MARHQITPAWQTQRGGVVQAAGCAVGVPVAGAKVFGETRQNLWSNPTGSTNGVTITPQEDGGLSISGDVSQRTPISVVTHALKPSATYTLSCDKVMMDNSDSGFYVQFYQNGSLNTFYATGKGTSVAFTVPSDAEYATCGVIVQPGYTQGTYRVMLNEGSAAQPWCPPGLSSVSEVGLVCAGRNLLPVTSPLHPSGSSVTVGDGQEIYATDTGSDKRAWGYELRDFEAYLPAGEYKMVLFVDETTDSVTANVCIYDDAGSRIAESYDEALQSTGTKNIPFELTRGTAVGVMCKLYTARVRICIAQGNAEIDDYPKYVGSATPIDLSGHQLRSLPDGTRDVLTVDGSGAVEIEQAVWSVALDGSSDEVWNVYAQGVYQFPIYAHMHGNDAGYEGIYMIRCDTLPVVDAIWQADKAGQAGVALSNGDHGNIYFRFPPEVTDVSTLRTWLASHPTTVVYKLAAPAAVPLDPITPPTVPASDATLWAASDVPCDLEATTWTASGAEQGRQQAAMAALAQQVRQQAETVAALAAQSLED